MLQDETVLLRETALDPAGKVITGSGGAREPLIRVSHPQQVRDRIQREVARL